MTKLMAHRGMGTSLPLTGLKWLHLLLERPLVSDKDLSFGLNCIVLGEQHPIPTSLNLSLKGLGAGREILVAYQEKRF